MQSLEHGRPIVNGYSGQRPPFYSAIVEALADIAFEVNRTAQNIGARRLHTVMERLLDQISFDAPEMADKNVTIDEAYVDRMLADIVKDQDLSRYIL